MHLAGSITRPSRARFAVTHKSHSGYERTLSPRPDFNTRRSCVARSCALFSRTSHSSNGHISSISAGAISDPTVTSHSCNGHTLPRLTTAFTRCTHPSSNGHISSISSGAISHPTVIFCTGSFTFISLKYQNTRKIVNLKCISYVKLNKYLFLSLRWTTLFTRCTHPSSNGPPRETAWIPPCALWKSGCSRWRNGSGPLTGFLRWRRNPCSGNWRNRSRSNIGTHSHFALFLSLFVLKVCSQTYCEFVRACMFSLVIIMTINNVALYKYRTVGHRIVH